MNGGEIDRFPVSQLQARYNLARSAVYTRLDALGIKSYKVGNRAFITGEQLSLMDELHEFLQTGRSTAEFLEIAGLSQPVEAGDPEPSSGLSLGRPEIFQLVAAIAAEMTSRFQPPSPEPDPLAYFEALERTAQNGWLLKTSEVAYLLDLAPTEVESYGDRFFEAGFCFTRAGRRAGGEVAWKVSKL